MKTTLSLAQRNAVAIAVLLNILLPFWLYPYKRDILDFSPIAFWIFLESLSLLLPLASMWVLAKHFQVAPKAYGLPLPPKLDLDMFGLSALVAVSIAASYVPARHIAWALLWEYSAPPLLRYHDLLPEGVWRIPVVLEFSFEAGFFESVVFIGLPWLLFHDRCNTALRRTVFSILSCLAFAANHRGHGFFEVVAVFFFGLAAVLWYLKLRELWPVVFGHTVVDVLGYM